MEHVQLIDLAQQAARDIFWFVSGCAAARVWYTIGPVMKGRNDNP